MNLLHVDASILGTHSVSRQLTAAIADRLREGDPGLVVTYRDLAAEPLAHLTPEVLPDDHPLAALRTADDPAARALSAAVLEEFLAADVVVVGAPMYNFTIPSQLKAWIDRLLIPGKTFTYSEQGPAGLAGGKRVIVALSRGGIYAAGMPTVANEHVEPVLRTAFGFMGITNPEFIVAEGIRVSPEIGAKALAGALQAARELSAA
ncbi:MAG TPA: FMN-dependent NADH-azoreductase [Candidatus Limnocylindria bacterium]|nr:FMN-dependent NADH-azoreductase [Candidatus Limnocylindria bacterium]